MIPATCPPSELLRGLIDETLKTADRGTIEAHVNDCVACQTRLESLTSDPLIESMRSTDAVDLAPPDLVKHVVASIIQSHPGKLLDDPSRFNKQTSGIADSSHPIVQQSSGVRFHDAFAFAEPPQTNRGIASFGKYEIIRLIGRGGAGLLYEAWDRTANRPVALKLLRDLDANSQTRLIQEGRVAAAIEHEHVLPIFEIIEATPESPPMLAMKLLSGQTVADVSQSLGDIDGKRVATLVRQAAMGTAAIHAAGFVHRDIKPSNLMMDDGCVLVGDFGLVRDDALDSDLTKTGELAGTPAFMSPEQIRDARTVDCRTDVYSLGCVLYQLLTGRPPFDGTVRMVLWRILNDDPTPVRRLDDRVDRDLETICHHAMSKRPADRYQSASSMAADLQRYLDGQAIHARPLGPVAKILKMVRNRPTLFSLLAGLILASGIIAAISFAAAVRLRNANEVARREAVAASESRDIAMEAMENMVFDVYDQLDSSEFDPDEVQIALLESAAKGLDRIEAGNREPLKTHQAEVHNRLARALYRVDRYRPAIQHAQQALAAIDAMPTDLRASQTAQVLKIKAMATIAFCRVSGEIRSTEIKDFQAFKDAADSVLADYPEDKQAIAATSDATQALAYAIDETESPESAIVLFQETIRIHSRLGDTGSLRYLERLDRLSMIEDLATCFEDASRWLEALESYEILHRQSNQAILADQREDALPSDTLTGDFLVQALLGKSIALLALEDTTTALAMVQRAWEESELHIADHPDDENGIDQNIAVIKQAIKVHRQLKQSDEVKRWKARLRKY